MSDIEFDEDELLEDDEEVAPEPAPVEAAKAEKKPATSAFVRAENEDDDGYDPYSDRPAAPSPLFERDPWS
jgi:hypothetical protein